MSQSIASPFRFAIMGAGKIAYKFHEAVMLLDNCQVVAIASKSMDRARTFADKCSIPHAYDSYEQMLIEQKPDCVYIAATTNAHYELTMLCLQHNTPVICEKAMFTNSADAREAFALAAEKKVFAMEAMWSRFLPAVNRVKEWLEAGRIGAPVHSDCRVGFRAAYDPDNRFYSKELGGGASFDVTVYCYEITTWMFGEPVSVWVDAAFTDTGVAGTDRMMLRFAGKDGAPDVLSNCEGSIMADLKSEMVIYGTEGMIRLPLPQCAEEAYLYDKEGKCIEHFKDTLTKNGFTYEAQEVIDCIRAGKFQSEIVPHSLTIACAEMFDMEEACRIK